MVEMVEENFEFTGKAKSTLFKVIAVGLVLAAFGIFGLSQGWWDPAHASGHHASLMEQPLLVEHTSGHDEAMHQANEAIEHANAGHVENHGAHEEHGGYTFMKRVKVGLWVNNIYFLGLAIVGVFFFAINYVTWSGWSAGLTRVFLSLGSYLLVATILTLGLFFFSSHDLFHWTHDGIAETDHIIASKTWYLNLPFYIGRMVVILGGWSLFHYFLKREAKLEDNNGGVLHHARIINWSAGFIVFFGVSSSMGAWDWIMSIDTHWFSTLFGWFVFSSWFVSGLAVITLLTIFLKEAGYLKVVSTEHLHDLGKYLFAFSIFWTYIWFSQFILYYYSNIPEETIYFVERLFFNMGNYAPIFVINLLINFLFPFLFLMTRGSKRVTIMLKVAAIGILIGHWFDFYLMIAPGVLKEHGGLNVGMLFFEVGVTMVFGGLFVFTVLKGLTTIGLIAKNHPFLEESIHHHT